MKRIIIFGNAGSGKSTLAKKLAKQFKLTHLDLDTLAWLDTDPPSRKQLNDSAREMDRLLDQTQEWVIEGGYSDLLVLKLKQATEVFFLNLGVATCIDNCRSRPWEPHKYNSPEEQNNNLDMLIDWLKQYPFRDDDFSLTSHQQLFNDFTGKKMEFLTLPV